MGEAIVFNVVTTVLPLILAIAVHEWAHIAMARFLGDSTGTSMGRYTLNPLAHVDPIWTVGLPIYFVFMQTIAGAAFPVPFFAAGKPAPYSPAKLDRQFNGKRIRMGTAELLVAAAGPISNLVMAAASTLLMVGLIHTGETLDYINDPRSLAILAFKFIILNIGLFTFNLIPIPPLDGSKILFNLLPRSIGLKYQAVTEKLSWVLLILLFAGGARIILAPIQSFFIELILRFVYATTG
ncbi:MAG: site-2 protease family protein [Deltaproteobacteria bacterium]|nr:site-2 protease family protein [Deltaproteobacteria bacterium]